METLARLLVRLRAERGWSQGDLADAVPVSTDTVAKIEQGRGRWSRQTAFRAMTAIGRALPLTPADAGQLMRLTGLLEPDEDLPPTTLARFIEMGIVADGDRQPLGASPPSIRQQLHALVDELADAHGAAATMDALRGIAVLARIRAAAPPAIASASAAPFPPNPESAPPASEHNPITRANDTDDEPDSSQTHPGSRRLVSQREGVTEHGVPYVEERYHYEQQQPDPTPPKPRRKTG